MKDRISGKPGRVLITPENGSAPYYAVMTRADEPEQEGTALNKANLLTDETAELLGLSADAVPNDAWKALHHHGWRDVFVVLDTSQNWTVPEGVTEIDFIMCGGGGGAGVLSGDSRDTYYGGNGGEVKFGSSKVIPGEIISCVIGAGGVRTATTAEDISSGYGGATTFCGVTAAGGKPGIRSQDDPTKPNGCGGGGGGVHAGPYGGGGGYGGRGGAYGGGGAVDGCSTEGYDGLGGVCGGNGGSASADATTGVPDDSAYEILKKVAFLLGSEYLPTVNPSKVTGSGEKFSGGGCFSSGAGNKTYGAAGGGGMFGNGGGPGNTGGYGGGGGLFGKGGRGHYTTSNSYHGGGGSIGNGGSEHAEAPAAGYGGGGCYTSAGKAGCVIVHWRV